MLDFYQFLSLASLALQVSRDCETNFKSRLARDARPLKNPNSGPKVLIDCLTIFLGAEKCQCPRIRGKNEKLSC